MATELFSNKTQQQILCYTKLYPCDTAIFVLRTKANERMREQKKTPFALNMVSSFAFCLLFLFSFLNVVNAQAGNTDLFSGSNKLIVTTTTTTVDYVKNMSTIQRTVNDISNEPPVEIESTLSTTIGLAFAHDDPNFGHGEIEFGEIHQHIQIDTVVKRGDITILEFTDYTHSTKSPSVLPSAHPTNVPTTAPTAVPTVSPTFSPTVSPTGSPTQSPQSRTRAPTTDAPTLPPLPRMQANSQITSAKEKNGAYKGSSKTSIIVGSIVGVSAILALCVVAAVLVMKNKKHSYEDDIDNDDIEHQSQGPPSYPLSFSSRGSTDSAMEEIYLGEADPENRRGNIDLRKWNASQSSAVSILHNRRNDIESFEVQHPW
mmetsp:Transcript_46687/g.54546  ORF Transcript_46687/g.54546 Transcript_46687/m.54546 type:complete len:373 (+) Transcript_46687:74-1192(+)